MESSDKMLMRRPTQAVTLEMARPLASILALWLFQEEERERREQQQLERRALEKARPRYDLD